MNKLVLALTALLALAPAALFAHDQPAKNGTNCGCACCQGQETCCCHEEKAPEAKTDEAKRHPLAGVIVEVYAVKSSLLVKHQDIPGFMAAMTMLFKVDAATLKGAVKGQAITGVLVQQGEDFWLEELKPAKP